MGLGGESSWCLCCFVVWKRMIGKVRYTTESHPCLLCYVVCHVLYVCYACIISSWEKESRKKSLEYRLCASMTDVTHVWCFNVLRFSHKLFSFYSCPVALMFLHYFNSLVCFFIIITINVYIEHVNRLTYFCLKLVWEINSGICLKS